MPPECVCSPPFADGISVPSKAKRFATERVYASTPARYVTGRSPATSQSLWHFRGGLQQGSVSSVRFAQVVLLRNSPGNIGTGTPVLSNGLSQSRLLHASATFPILIPRSACCATHPFLYSKATEMLLVLMSMPALLTKTPDQPSVLCLCQKKLNKTSFLRSIRESRRLNTSNFQARLSFCARNKYTRGGRSRIYRSNKSIAKFHYAC